MQQQKRLQHKVFLGLLIVLVAFSGLATGCTGQQPQATTPVPDTGGQVEPGSPQLSATGEVIPARQSTLSFATEGPVVELLVEVGDKVKQGDVIARLDTTVLEAEVRREEASLAYAQANLESAKRGSRPEEIQEAEQLLAVTSAGVAEASATRDDVFSGASDAEVLEAKRDVQAAFADMIAARAQRDYLQDVINNIEDYNEFIRRTYTQDLVDDAQVQYEFAMMNLDAAQAYLDDLLDGPTTEQIRLAEAELWAASARYLAQEAELKLLLLGPRPELIQVAESQVEQADARLRIVELELERAVLVAPFDGTVSELYIQKYQLVATGQPILLLADLENLRVETTDLNELDVASIAVGDTVMLSFDALPGVEVEGRVIRVSPKAEEGTGVNFTILIEVDEMPEAVRWGMTAFVDIET